MILSDHGHMSGPHTPESKESGQLVEFLGQAPTLALLWVWSALRTTSAAHPRTRMRKMPWLPCQGFVRIRRDNKCERALTVTPCSLKESQHNDIFPGALGDGGSMSFTHSHQRPNRRRKGPGSRPSAKDPPHGTDCTSKGQEEKAWEERRLYNKDKTTCQRTFSI